MASDKVARILRSKTELSNEEIDRLARRAYLSYHTRPWFLLRSALKVRSWKEFRRKFRAFVEMHTKQETVSKRDKAFMAYNENAIPLPH